MKGVLKTITPDVSCAPANTHGTLKGKLHLLVIVESHSSLTNLKTLLSVRTGIHQGHADFLVTADSWPLFLYANYTCDPNDIEKGLFKSSLLIKVCDFLSLFLAVLSDFPTGLQVPIYLTIICVRVQ